MIDKITHQQDIENFKKPITPIPISELKHHAFCKVHIAGMLGDDFKKFDPLAYKIFCELGKNSQGLSYFPNSRVILLKSNSPINLVNNMETIVPNIALELDKNVVDTTKILTDFFENKAIRVEPIGWQGKVYKAGKYMQNWLPMAHAYKAVTIAQTLGMKGVGIISGAPFSFVSVTYLGSITLYYGSLVAGDNVVGKALDMSAWLFARPMWVVEFVLNGIILQPISKVTGFPMIINGTQEISRGIGIDFKDFTKIGIAASSLHEKVATSKRFAKLKKIWKIIKGVDETGGS
jgi:hypothetical protein